MTIEEKLRLYEKENEWARVITKRLQDERDKLQAVLYSKSQPVPPLEDRIIEGCGRCIGTLDNLVSVWLWCGATPERAKYQPKAEGYLCPDCAAKLVQERDELRELVKMYRELRHIANAVRSLGNGCKSNEH